MSPACRRHIALSQYNIRSKGCGRTIDPVPGVGNAMDEANKLKQNPDKMEVLLVGSNWSLRSVYTEFGGGCTHP